MSETVSVMLAEHMRSIHDLQHAMWLANRFLIKHGQRPVTGPWYVHSTSLPSFR